MMPWWVWVMVAWAVCGLLEFIIAAPGMNRGLCSNPVWKALPWTARSAGWIAVLVEIFALGPVWLAVRFLAWAVLR